MCLVVTYIKLKKQRQNLTHKIHQKPKGHGHKSRKDAIFFIKSTELYMKQARQDKIKANKTMRIQNQVKTLGD
jgi:hypothetical protein